MDKKFRRVLNTPDGSAVILQTHRSRRSHGGFALTLKVDEGPETLINYYSTPHRAAEALRASATTMRRGDFARVLRAHFA